MTFLLSCYIVIFFLLWKNRLFILFYFILYFLLGFYFILSVFYVLFFCVIKNIVNFFFIVKNVIKLRNFNLFKIKIIPCFFTWTSKSFFSFFPCFFYHAKFIILMKKNIFWSTSYSETLLTNIFHFIPRF